MARFRTIVADPPWHYHSWPVNRGARKGQRDPIPYPTMTVAEIAALPVQDLAVQSGCHLYLWTTNRYVRDSFAIVERWGFRYSQLLTWAKTPMGIGPGGTFAQNAEYIVFARSGSLRHLRRGESVWFNWPRTMVHSRKPEAFQDIVEQVSPGPYLEMFARRPRVGWSVWGNEVESDIELRAA